MESATPGLEGPLPPLESATLPLRGAAKPLGIATEPLEETLTLAAEKNDFAVHDFGLGGGWGFLQGE